MIIGFAKVQNFIQLHGNNAVLYLFIGWKRGREYHYKKIRKSLLLLFLGFS